VLDVLAKKDNLSIMETGIRRFFVVKGYEEVADFMKKWKFNKKESRLLRSADFSTAYTSIPHADLNDKLGIVFEEAWAFIADREDMGIQETAIKWIGRSNVEFVRVRQRNRRHQFTYSLQQVKELMRWLIQNIYVVNGGECRRQRRGIPMGTNAGPGICNLYLYYYESRYIDGLIADGESQKAEECHITFRLIDDVQSVDNPNYESLIQCYPQFLQLNDTTLETGGTNFLGMNITQNQDHKIMVRVHDKRKEFPFKVVRYPHLDSEIPSDLPYGVFTGLTHRHDRICTEREDFVRESADLAATLLRQGAIKSRLIKSFASYVGRKGRSKVGDLRRSFKIQFDKKIRNQESEPYQERKINESLWGIETGRTKMRDPKKP